MPETLLRNRYRVLRRLGAGGVGSVYMVEELRRGAGVPARLALKAVFADDSQQALLASLRLEFRVLANLRHPLLARVYDFGSFPSGIELEGAEGRPGFFFTRDLVDGRDLESHCEGQSIAEICLCCQRTAEVLDVLHRAGMVHGDFKPANVIVSPDGRPHLIDFGLVHNEGQNSLPSGTAAYLAPETLRGAPVDRRVDLYALGISIYQLVAGRLPLPGANLGELIAWHLDGDPLRLSLVRRVPEELDEVVHRLTLRDPERRYPSAAEAAVALAEAAISAGATPLARPPRIYVPPAPGENLGEPRIELEGAIRQRVAGEGGAALLALEGDPGAGKSTLLQELAWRSQLAGVEVVRAEFRAGDPRANGIWSDLLAEVSGAVGTPHPLEALEAAPGDRYAIYQRISSYLAESASRSPLLILLDSVEQADAESRAALRFLAHTLKPTDRVLCVAAYRSDDELHQALDAPTRIRLRPLSGPDVRRMLADARGRADDELAGRILGHTGGNPLFVHEVLRRLAEAGWPANPDLHALAPPRSLEEVYAARLRELSSDERAVLDALSVMGRPTSGRLLMDVLLHAWRELEQTLVGLPLEHLEQLEWLDRSPDGAYRFRQGPAARAVYAQIEVERRRALHHAAARVLERTPPVDPVEWTRHALGADRLDLALQTAAQAIRKLGGLGAHRAAIEIGEEVVARLEPGAPLRAMLRTLGELHRTVGDYERAQRTLERSCEDAEPAELASSQIELARVAVAGGDSERALTVLEELLASSALEPELRLRALSVKSSALLALVRYEALLGVTEQALAIEAERSAQGTPDPLVRAELRGLRAWALASLQRSEEAAQSFALALEDARAAADPRSEATILNRWAAMAVRQAAYAEVPARYGAALDCARRSGDVERVATIRYNLSLFHYSRGEYAACLPHLEESLRLYEAMGAQARAGVARSSLGMLQLKLGLYEQARASLAEALEEMRRVGHRGGEALARLLLALVHARRGKLEEARRGLEEARAIFLDLDERRDAADVLLDTVDVELAGGDLARAREALEKARREIDGLQAADLEVRLAALRARAAVRADLEEQREAARLLERAMERAVELSSQELAWETRAAAMELDDALGRPARAVAHAVAGAAILEAMAADLAPDLRAAFWQEPRRLAVRDRAALHAAGSTLPPEALAPSGSPPLSELRSGSRPALQRSASRPISAPMFEATLPTIANVVPKPGDSAPQLPVVSLERIRAGIEERFYRLLEIYRQINSELDPERLLGLTMDTAVELTGAERGFLLLGASPDELRIEVARNLDPEGETAAYSRSIAERVFTSGQPVITVSAHNDPRFKEYLSVHQLQLESVLGIPIHARGRTAGVLYMESRFQSGRFTPEDQRLLMAFGDQVAIALTNARLHQDNLRKAKELEAAKLKIEALAEERGRLLSERTVELEETRRDLAETRRKLESQVGIGRFGMVGRSPAMLKLFELIDRLAATDVPVLIEGESGTGKEMVARAIHTSSERRKGRLVSVNCAAIPETLLESELFGHVRGAFTGADRERKGLFASAHGGSLFLDEIGDMPARMQVDLLRALQEKTIRPVGGHDEIKVDVRVIAASNKPLAALVQRGSFREDLFYRLNVVSLRLPPLRERPDDIPLLADHFLAAMSTQMRSERKRLTKEALRRLLEYGWPGNVRQLEHVLMNAAVLADSATLDLDDLNLEAPATAPAAPPAPEASTSEDHRNREKRRILEALEACNWNKSRAAQILNIPRRTFYRRLTAFGIQ
jgi:transcriptional regulator with GAF, ATPase, and Fis domain/tetratricopeptide (TPR) repeat protein